MDRLQKKCFIASSGMHGVLVLVVIFGAAFFTPEKKAPPVETLTIIPAKLLDGVLSGGGGNPKIAPSEAKIQGDTLNPVPTPPTPQPPKPKVTEKPPQPKPPEPKSETTKTIPKDPPKTTPKQAPIELTPVSKSK